ncbi:MAG: hypothetical protein AAF570_04400 [Bacteroidota bacterium]
MTSTKFILENQTDSPLRLLLEPWGEDYTLVKGEVFSLQYGEDEEVLVQTQIRKDGVVLYVEKGDYPVGVFVDGAEVGCGYGKSRLS